MPPGWGPLAISPTFGKVIFWRASEINRNFQRNFKGQWIQVLVIYLAPPHPTFLRHSGRIWSALRPR